MALGPPGAGGTRGSCASTTNPEARLARKKGPISWLACMGHLMTENRNGLVLSARVTEADHHIERLAALKDEHGRDCERTGSFSR